MNIVIFGYGQIAKTKYLPYLLRETGSSDRRTVRCVDRAKTECLDAGTWARHIDVPLGEIDKVLILSPPTAHFENLSSIATAYAGIPSGFPEVFIEKPVYLAGERKRWTSLLAVNDCLEERVFYIDHYRFKDAIRWFLGEKSEVLGLLGAPLEEIGFVSLEKQRFWDSDAFAAGYLLEHGCHFVTLLHQIFPELGSCGLVPRRERDWKAWVEIGRPPRCRADSAALLFLGVAGGESASFRPDGALTVIIGKGMVDKKVLYIKGPKGSCQLWFNAGRRVVCTGAGRWATEHEPGDSYEGVVKTIIDAEREPGLLMSLRNGMAEQEEVIAIRERLPRKMGAYAPGRIPEEITRELVRMGLNGGS